MRLLSAVLSLIVVVLFSSAISAQSPQLVSQSVPRLVNITGVFRPADGLLAGPAETITLSIYADPEGGVPLWQETQTVAIDAQGRYSLLLGATSPDGIPAAVFGGEAAHWLGRVFERAGEVEGPRTRLISVPYALRAADADTLGGRPASAYVLAPTVGDTGSEKLASATPGSSSDVVAAGTPGVLAKYTNTTDLGNSAVFESGGLVGIGTVVPLDAMHVTFNNTNGGMTGVAVQNLGNTAASYSGMLFYDHTNALAQFQGYNNVTHEYRINNIARVTPGGAFNGSINFMLGGASKFIVAPNGNIGIGTTGPSALLEVSNAIPGGPANMWMTSYTNAVGPYYMARRARGTAGAPTPVQNGDALAGFYGEGYGPSGFGPGFAGGMTVQTIQNWTDTAHGTALAFSVTPLNATAPVTRMTLDGGGNFGIGTSTPVSLLEVSNAAPSFAAFGQVTTSTFGNSASPSLFVGSKARGTSAAPAGVQINDSLAGFLARGYGATAFSGTRGGMFVRAAETWTDTAQGTWLAFNTTIPGTNVPGTRMTLDPFGNLGIGTTGPQAAVEIVRQGGAEFLATTYSGASDSGEFNFMTRVARGTPIAPTAVQSGDELGGFGATGYGTTGFGEFGAGFGTFAAENWTDTAQGAVLVFGTTPLGSNEAQITTIIMPDGNTGIGLPITNAFPVVTDRLEVFGDIRVGTTGTNGCLKNFAGTGIVGTCASDRRFKKEITPFGSVLNQLAALQPVHYYWRAEDFPNRHFGNSRSYGLIAQDVEQVLPELVATDSEGYKAIDYSELPLLTIQAVKELKAENDVLKQRVAELERMIAEVLAAARR
jgi:hypothetical protein